MSLLTDRDFLLHTLQLNYIRHVLPNHAPQSTLPGTGAHNLIAFDPSSASYNSPYVVLAGLTDETKWPELSSGRSSPPLAPAYQRGESSSSGTGGRRRGAAPSGGPGLNYTQTIVGKGSGVGGAGMRVGGRQRSWKGRGGGLEEATTQEDRLAEPSEVHDGPSDNLNRRKSLEATIHRRRLQDTAASLQLPPVVVHSPVRSPLDSPSSTVDPSRASTPTTPAMQAPHRPIAVPVDLAAAAAKLENVDQSEAPSEAPSPFLDAAGSSLEAPSPMPLSPATDGSFLSSSAPLARIDSQSPISTSPNLISSLHSSPSISSVPDVAGSSSLGGRYASMASSGVSLFGVSRLNGTGEGLMGRDRSDSDSSSFAPGSSNTRVEVIDEDEDEELPPPPPPPPAFQVPRNFRARERRRVNISGRMLVPITEPANEGDSPAPHPVPAFLDTSTRPRSNTEPTAPREGTTTAGADPVVRETSPQHRTRKISAPPSMLNLESAARNAAGSAPTSSAPGSPASSRGPRPPGTPSRHHSGIVFTRRADVPTKLPPPAPKRSALTAILNAKDDSPSASNPFSRLYAALASKGSDALMLTLYFPESKTPSKKLKVGVKKDLTVEEVIGAGLWAYWEEGREPKLEVGDGDQEYDETTKWNLRIVEDDGEVDEDFPALDRMRAISAFSFDEFAIVPATGSQLKDNQSKQASIQRRPSRVLGGPKRSLVQPTGAPSLAPPGVASAQPGNVSGSPGTSLAPAAGSFHPGTMGVSSALAIPVLLRVRLPPAPSVDEINTTVSVPNDMYMSDVLDHICKKRGIQNPKDWALLVRHNNSDIVVPLDRTVDSLGDERDLILVRRSDVAGRPGVVQPRNLQNNNPSASIFKRLSEPPQPKYQSTADLTSNYQRWNVQRKLPMPLGRHPRTIAIDGDYIHFMPSASDNKGLFEGGRTSSFHISMVHDCKVSRRAPATFKMLVQKNGRDKRYDFEAENPKQANEIVAFVRTLMATFRAEEAKRARVRLL